MKKKSIVFGLSLFFLIFLSTNVSALSACSYQWKEEWGERNIFLTSENSSTEFDKILTSDNSKYKFAKDNTIFIQGHGTCPYIAFDKDKKVYSSRDKCLEVHGRTSDECSLEISGQWVTSSGNSSEDDNDSSEGDQAVLTSKTSTQCVYQANANVPILGYGRGLYSLNVSSNNGSGYKPDFSCDYDGHKSCILETNAAYFYGANEATGTSFLCPKYIYFKAGTTSNGRIKVTITGSGDNGDTNHSGVESNVEGDKRKPSEDTSISISDGTVDCSIFENGFGQFLMEAYKLIKFAVPILIIAFAIVDFVKAMASQDEAEVKKSANKLVKRLVIGVLIFVLPTIIEYVLSLAGIDYGTCGIK